MAESHTQRTRTCGTMAVHERLLRTASGYMAARAASETRAWQSANRMAPTARTGVTVIPVVVHVVYKTNAQNISDAQIQSQIAILNQDYRKTNADVSSTPAAFQPLCGDARVEFELAKTDANGNPTSGVTRTQTTANSFVDDDKVKSSTTGGADAWPADKYLNLWVCELGANLLGYAQFPGGPPTTDGVVILHSAFGNTGTAAAPFDLGRTATHEIGHWLNLRHIWGDDGTGCSGDDFVADTPNAAGSNTGKPGFPHVTCNNGPNGDLFMNYMDYVDDAAMFMFTNGQVARMQACLDGDRSLIGHIKAGPTIVAADVHPTVAAIDVHPTVAAIDLHPTVAAIDMHPTVAAIDVHPTVAAIDVHPTMAALDVHPTIAAIDVGPTLARIDWVKTPAFDKSPFADMLKPPFADGPSIPAPGDPGLPMPFVLATPHHSMAWTQSYPEMAGARVAALATQIAQYEQMLAQYAQAEAAGLLSALDAAGTEQLTAEYYRLVAEYRQLTGA